MKTQKQILKDRVVNAKDGKGGPTSIRTLPNPVKTIGPISSTTGQKTVIPPGATSAQKIIDKKAILSPKPIDPGFNPQPKPVIPPGWKTPSFPQPTKGDLNPGIGQKPIIGYKPSPDIGFKNPILNPISGPYKQPISPDTQKKYSPIPQPSKDDLIKKYGPKIGTIKNKIGQPQPYDITKLPNYNPALPFSGLTPEQIKIFEASSSNYQYKPM